MSREPETSGESDDARNRRVTLLEEARALSLEGTYDEALQIVESLLQDRAADVEALRLKGNVLELKALELNEYSSKKLMASREYLDARRCYEQALAQDPENSVALIDLGDHYKNLDAYDRALNYYTRAVNLLEAGISRLPWREEVQEILERMAELPRSEANSKGVEEVLEKCRKLLSNG